MMKIKVSMFLTLAALLLCNCAEQSPTTLKQGQSTVAGGPVAQLYLFNISGPTLIPHSQKLLDNGNALPPLPRKRYQVVAISAGDHVIRYPYRERPEVHLQAVAGETYYLVHGYSPAKFWAFPIGGDPLMMQLISKEEAQPLLDELTAQ